MFNKDFDIQIKNIVRFIDNLMIYFQLIFSSLNVFRNVKDQGHIGYVTTIPSVLRS